MITDESSENYIFREKNVFKSLSALDFVLMVRIEKGCLFFTKLVGNGHIICSNVCYSKEFPVASI